jgi:hypothetical protein
MDRQRVVVLLVERLGDGLGSSKNGLIFGECRRERSYGFCGSLRRLIHDRLLRRRILG